MITRTEIILIIFTIKIPPEIDLDSSTETGGCQDPAGYCKGFRSDDSSTSAGRGGRRGRENGVGHPLKISEIIIANELSDEGKHHKQSYRHQADDEGILDESLAGAAVEPFQTVSVHK